MVGYISKSSADATASPHYGRLANDLLRTRLEKADYYEAATTLVLWCHKWRPIQFVLLVDNFGIEYVGKEHALHLLKTLEKNYDITTDYIARTEDRKSVVRAI